MDEMTHRAKFDAPNETYLRDGVALRDDRSKKPDLTTKPRAKPQLGIWLGLALLLGFGIYRVVSVIGSPKEANTDRLTAPQPVGVATIKTGDIKVIVTGLGAVTPIATITVKTQINGQLRYVAFQEGQMVKKGDFLAQIDPRPYELLLAQYEGQLVHDQGLLDQAKIDLVRYETLVKQNSIARQQAEDQAFIVKQYEGSVKTDQAQIDTEKLNLLYAHIVSPIDGRVGLRLVDAGNYVQTTDTTGLAVLTQLHPITVIFTLPEDDIPEVMASSKAGTPLDVTAYDRANLTLLSEGKVATIDNEIDPTTGMVKLRANFDNLDDKLFPNQFVNARLLLKSLHNVVTVPEPAILHGAPGTFVYLVGADDKVTVQKVTLGPLDGNFYAVTAGLKPGDRVVVDGADRLRDGTQVLIASSDGQSVSPTNSDNPTDGNKAAKHRHSSHSNGEPSQP